MDLVDLTLVMDLSGRCLVASQGEHAIRLGTAGRTGSVGGGTRTPATFQTGPAQIRPTHGHRLAALLVKLGD